MTEHLILQFSTSADTLANWASAAIRRLNHSPFSHVDFVLPDGNMLGASDQGAHSPCILGNPQGVAVRPPDYQVFGLRRRMILRTDKADAVIAAAMVDLGAAFDDTSLWDFLSSQFPGARDWRTPGKWFCSEHKLCKLEDGGFFAYKLPWPKNRVSPTDLLLLLLMDERWTNRETFWNPVEGLPLGPGEK